MAMPIKNPPVELSIEKRLVSFQRTKLSVLPLQTAKPSLC